MKALLRSIILSLLVLSAPLSAQSLDNQVLDRVVAVVDEGVILQSDLDRAVGNIVNQYAGQSDQLPPPDVLQRQVLDHMILGRVQAQRARDTGIRISEVQVDSAIAEVAQQNSMTPDQLRMSLQNDGVSYSEFRETIRDELLIQNLRQRFMYTQVSVSDTEIENLLGSGQLQRGDVHLGHILIAVPDGADAETIELGREKAEGVRQLIIDGMDFSAAAIRYSNASNALEGGDLGWRSLTEVPSVFVDIVGQMSDGEITPPIRGPLGFHILTLYGTRSDSQRLVEEYHARHIMIAYDELVSESQAERQIRDIHQQLLDGADFAELARERSTDHNTGPLGGDMGWFPLDGYGSGVAMTITSLADNQISEPFRSDIGWHVLQRLGSRQQDRTDEILRRQAADAIHSRKAGEEYERFVRELRGEAYVENRLTLND